MSHEDVLNLMAAMIFTGAFITLAIVLGLSHIADVIEKSYNDKSSKIR